MHTLEFNQCKAALYFLLIPLNEWKFSNIDDNVMSCDLCDGWEAGVTHEHVRVRIMCDVWPRPWHLITDHSDCDWPLVIVRLLLTLFSWSGPVQVSSVISAPCHHWVTLTPMSGTRLWEWWSGLGSRIRGGWGWSLSLKSSLEVSYILCSVMWGLRHPLCDTMPPTSISSSYRDRSKIMNLYGILGHDGVLIVCVSPTPPHDQTHFSPRSSGRWSLPSCVSVFTPMLWVVSPSWYPPHPHLFIENLEYGYITDPHIPLFPFYLYLWP